MSSIKKLAGQTVWYGVSSIVARFLFYLLTPYLTLTLSSVGYGDMSILYAAIPFLNIIFTYGMETTFFRYSSKERDQQEVYNTAMISLMLSTIVLTTLVIIYRRDFASVLRLGKHPEFITYSVLIIAFDALSALPFARLRLMQRPRKYALIRVSAILFQMAVTYFLLSVCPKLAKEDPYGFIATFYDPAYGVGYVMIANMLASFFALIFLYKEFFAFELRFDKKLWVTMMVYSLPLVVAGFGGMINETFDRIMLTWLAPVKSEAAAKTQVAIYSGCYKLSILITLFVNAFKMGAEPFFFKQAEGQSPQKVYARVMKFFVITISLMFLVVSLYLDIWKYFLSREIYWRGLKVVPILLLANMFLGIYYNLTIWYKLTNKTLSGAYITLIGAAITLIINFIFIPVAGYMACAWATFFCYGSMMVISYVWGQKVYPVPYAWKKLLAYMTIVVIIYFIHELVLYFTDSFAINLASASVLLLMFAYFVLKVEKKEFQRMPVIGRYLRA